jgi:hypothetical protein
VFLRKTRGEEIMLNRSRNKILNWIVKAATCGPVGLELFMALSAARWAVYLLLPTGILVNSRSQTIAYMAKLAPAWTWALVFLVLGSLQVLVVILDGKAPVKLRQMVALFGVFWWLAITLLDCTTGFSAGAINLATFVVAQVLTYMLLVLAYDNVCIE